MVARAIPQAPAIAGAAATVVAAAMAAVVATKAVPAREGRIAFMPVPQSF